MTLGIGTEDNNMTFKATFAAGCFWGVEESFRRTNGVVSTRVGYTGGMTENPTYREVCTDRTGHAEAVELEYDPSIISYEGLLDVFWSAHDPTTLNRQGPDFGSQYRSAIFYHSPEQQEAARKSLNQIQNDPRFRTRRIVTQLLPAQEFYPAEDYHQRYLQKQGLATCHI